MIIEYPRSPPKPTGCDAPERMNHAMHTDFILFDLDGTLTDPAEGITRSVAHALAKRGIAVPELRALHPFIGPPLIDSFMRFYGFSHAEAVRAVTDYREYYAIRGIFENAVYPGIPALLRQLKSAGKWVGMATSKPEPYAVQIADHFGLTPYFDAVCGSLMDETRTAKSDVITYLLETHPVARDRAVMVGDRCYDVTGARALGIPCIGVTYGYGSPDELRTAGAAALADSPDALAALLLHHT